VCQIFEVKIKFPVHYQGGPHEAPRAGMQSWGEAGITDAVEPKGKEGPLLAFDEK